MPDPTQVGDGNPDGMVLGQDATTAKVGLFGVTPVVQPTATNQAAITDSSGGTVGTTIAATLGRVLATFPVNDMSAIADGDLVTDFIPGFAGKVLAIDWITGVIPASTSSKASTITVEIETTGTTGGVLSMTTSDCDTIGEVLNGTAITALNTFTAAEKISIVAASTTAFGEGEGYFVLTLQNDDMVNAIASLAALQDEIRTAMVNFGSMKGS